ncbi:MAG TPA: DUF502 domain-containing protein, partial [Candidatus Krumholzibacterium sp.]|nr:DUF502 domain-containing protein [Candidatus Krumholzibacterium sp.]
MGWFRRRFFTGLVILLPTVLTGWLLYKVLVSMDRLLRPVLDRYPFLDIPGLGIIAVVALILLAGIFAGNFIGRNIIRSAENVVTRIPMISRMYTAIKQISEVFLRHERTVFREAILIQYPRPGIYVVGFVTSSWKTTVGGGPARDFVNVFLPTTPNPTSGLFLMIPSNEVIHMDCSVEDALKMVISGGAVIPPDVTVVPDAGP